MDELLAEVAKGLDLFVLGLTFALLAHESVLLVGGHLDQRVLRQFCTGFVGQV